MGYSVPSSTYYCTDIHSLIGYCECAHDGEYSTIALMMMIRFVSDITLFKARSFSACVRNTPTRRGGFG